MKVDCYAQQMTSRLPIEDVCGEAPSAVCKWAFDVSGGNETVTRMVDWLVGRPLNVVMILLVAWILTLISRRWLRRAINRMLASPTAVLKQLDSMGVPSSATAQLDDPRRSARARTIAAATAGFVAALIWVFALIAIASVLGVEVVPLLAGAGIVGVAVAFGSQALVQDCINGVFMLLEDQYGIGDSVDLGAASGVVEHLSLRTTVVRGLDGTLWHVPNGQIVRVGNQSQLWSVAVVDFIVSYDTDIGAARLMLHEAAAEVCDEQDNAQDILESPQVLGVESITGDGITLRLLVKTRPGAQWAIQRKIREAVKGRFDEAGVKPAMPRTIWMRGAGALPDPTE